MLTPRMKADVLLLLLFLLLLFFNIIERLYKAINVGIKFNGKQYC